MELVSSSYWPVHGNILIFLKHNDSSGFQNKAKRSCQSRDLSWLLIHLRDLLGVTVSISSLFLHRFHVFLDNFQFPLEHRGVQCWLCTSHSGAVQLSPGLGMGCCAGLYVFLEKETVNDCSSDYKLCLTIFKARAAANLHLPLSRVNICHCCFCAEQRRAGKMPTSTGMPAQRPACRTDDCERTRSSLHHIEGLSLKDDFWRQDSNFLYVVLTEELSI